MKSSPQTIKEAGVESLALACAVDPNRKEFAVPFRGKGGRWLVATNGKMMVAKTTVTTEAEIKTSADFMLLDAPPKEAVNFDARALADAVGEPELEGMGTCPECGGKSGARAECEECMGDGEHECSGCGDTHDCGKCDGKGYTGCRTCDGKGVAFVRPKARPIRIRGAVFDKNLVGLAFKALPKLRGAGLAVIDKNRLDLYGDGVIGVVCGLIWDGEAETFTE